MGQSQERVGNPGEGLPHLSVGIERFDIMLLRPLVRSQDSLIVGVVAYFGTLPKAACHWTAGW